MSKPDKHYGKWRIRWIDEAGRRRCEVFSNYKDAEYKLAQHRLEVEQVKRGLRAPASIPRGFGELCDYWLATRAMSKRSEKHDQSIIRAHLRPFFGVNNVGEIGVQLTDAYKLSRQHLHAKTINNFGE